MGSKTGLEIRVLGTPEFVRKGGAVSADTRKASALLAYLAVEGTTRRDRLAALFWPDSNDAQARATLRRTLSAIRSGMGDDAIESEREQIRLTHSVVTDVEEFDAALVGLKDHDHDENEVCAECVPDLRRALDLYRGDFLEGFSLRGAVEFDDWARTTAEAFRLRAERAHEQLATALAAAGDFRSAIETVNGWLALDPLREPAYRLLMLLYAWSGDRVGASEAYRRCVATLSDELDVPPLEETTELHQAILEEDLPPAPGQRRRIVARSSIPVRTKPGLIDREGELNRLTEALDDHGAVYRVSGEPWMGKTRLLEELIDRSDGSRLILRARGYRAESHLPYGVVSQLLTALVARDGWESLVSNAPGWTRGEAARIAPDLGDSDMTAAEDGLGETRLYDALTLLFSSAKALLVVDDAQWADPASSSILSYLINRIGATSVTLVLAHRNDESGELASVVLAASRTPSHLIELQPLTKEQIVGLAGSSEHASRLVTSTGGVPALIAEQLLSPLPDQPQPGIREFMQVRLGELDGLTRQVLNAAAVLSGTCTVEMLREVSGRSEDEVVGAVEQLVEGNLLVMDETAQLSFSLDAMEQILYQETSLVRRRLLHGRAAALLDARRGSDADALTAMAIARHYEQAGQDSPAAEWYARAGDLARSVFAMTEALDAYRRAIALGHSDGSGLRISIGNVYLFQGLFSAALTEFETAAAGSEGAQRALALHGSGESLRRLGRIDSALEYFADARTDHPNPVSLHCDWALALLRSGNQRMAREHADRAVVAAEKGPSADRSRALCVLGIVSGRRREARDSLQRALETAGDDPILRMAALNALAYSYASTGEDEEALQLVEEALRIADAIGDRHRGAALHNHLADLHHRAGRTELAEASLTRAVALFSEIEPGSWEPEVWLLTRW